MTVFLNQKIQTNCKAVKKGIFFCVGRERRESNEDPFNQFYYKFTS